MLSHLQPNQHLHNHEDCYYSINIGCLVLQLIIQSPFDITKNWFHAKPIFLARIRHVLTQYSVYNLTSTTLPFSFPNFASGSSRVVTGLQSYIPNLFSADERSPFWSIKSNFSFWFRTTDILKM